MPRKAARLGTLLVEAGGERRLEKGSAQRKKLLYWMTGKLTQLVLSQSLFRRRAANKDGMRDRSYQLGKSTGF